MSGNEIRQISITPVHKLVTYQSHISEHDKASFTCQLKQVKINTQFETDNDETRGCVILKKKNQFTPYNRDHAYTKTRTTRVNTRAPNHE